MNRLPAAAHRAFYNVADALCPPAAGAPVADIAPALEACLARRGEGAVRRLLGILGRLEKRPLRGWKAQAFSALPRLERKARLASLSSDDAAWLAALHAEAHDGLGRPAPATSAGPQSASGA